MNLEDKRINDVLHSIFIAKNIIYYFGHFFKHFIPEINFPQKELSKLYRYNGESQAHYHAS